MAYGARSTSRTGYVAFGCGSADQLLLIPFHGIDHPSSDTRLYNSARLAGHVRRILVHVHLGSVLSTCSFENF
jgi:hypothetical protein